jgi:hypothetical protein
MLLRLDHIAPTPELEVDSAPADLNRFFAISNVGSAETKRSYPTLDAASKML